MEVDRGYGDGTYRLHSINFTGRLVQLIEEGYTTMRLYEWVDRGFVVYLVHVEEDKSGRLPRRTLYPFINIPKKRSQLLFTGVRGREILGSPFPESCIAPLLLTGQDRLTRPPVVGPELFTYCGSR